MSHLTLAQAPAGLSLQLDLGAYHIKKQGLRSLPQVANIVKQEVGSIVSRYTTHREQALKHYGQLDLTRAAAIDRIRARFGDTTGWQALYLKPKLLGIADDLRIILPHPNSRHYKNQSKLVQELIEFAHSFHATQFLQ